LTDQVATHPEEARSHIFFGTFLASVGDYVGAEIYVKRAIELSPRKQVMYWTLAEIYAAQGKIKESVEMFRKAHELDTSFAEPRIKYALALLRAGDTKEANALLADVKEESLIDRRYINTFMALKRFDMVAKIFEKLIAEDPTNVQLRVSLSAAYLEAGERQKSIEVLESIAKVNPQLAKEVEYFIGEIRAGRNPIDK